MLPKELYLDMLLYTIIEKPKKANGELYYQDIRKIIIQIAHIPTKLSHIFFTEFVISLQYSFKP